MPRHSRRAAAAARGHLHSVDATVKFQDKGRALLAAAPPPQGFVAAASALAGHQRIRRATKRDDWQREAWDYVDTCGEFRYAQWWLASAGSRAELFVETQAGDGTWQRVTDTRSAAVAYLDELLNGCGGPSQFLYTSLFHMGVPGESFVVGADILDLAGTVIGYRWSVVDGGELDTTGRKPKLKDPETGEEVELGDEALIIRVWRPHPRDRAKADSPARAALPILREIEHIGKHISASIDSRLAGNGLLVLPKDVSITLTDGTTITGDAAIADGKDPFMAAFVAALVTPIADRDDPSAVVPIIARLPAEFVDKVQHITFSTPFDAQAQPLREAGVRRLAMTLDTPPEQLLGMSDANHWTGWQIEEGTVKTVTEPALQLICDALTGQFINPMMKIHGQAVFRVNYSVDKLILRPNRAVDFKTGYEHFVIGPKALREAIGADEGDAPTPAELLIMVALALAKTGRIDPTTGQILGLPANVTATDPAGGAHPLVPDNPPKPGVEAPAKPPSIGDTGPGGGNTQDTPGAGQ